MKRRKQKTRDPMARLLALPQYKKRIVATKKKRVHRKEKHKKELDNA